MKKVVKKVVSLLLVALMVFSVAPLAGFVGLELPEINLLSIGAKAEEVATSGTCGDNLTWTFDESTGELTISGTGAMDDYMYSSSPWADHRSSIKTLSISDDVTSIGNYAFASCSGLTNIELPDGLTNIGEHAFEHCVGLINITIPSNVAAINNYTFLGCENLTDIVISNGVATIGGYVFKDCDKLKTLNIPASVTYIRYDAFEYCYNLETINVDSANETYSSDEHGVLFNKDKTAIKKYPKGNRGKSYTIPDGVISIDKFAFRRCYYLTSLQIPDSVMYISENAFEESTIYENLDNWENGVLYISNHLIKANKSLKGVYQVREGTKSIAANAFVDCSGLTGVILPEGLASIDWGAFGFCVNLRGLVIPYGVTNIGEMAFFNCVAMEYIHVPSSVTSIGTDCIISDSSKAELIEDLKTYSEEELASLGFTKESVEAFSSTTLICSDSESAYAKTYARQNGNEFAVCDGHSGEEIPDASERLLLHSGFCGENLTFTLYADGELVISGTGDMYDWDEETPWYNYKQFIKTVTVDNGVTSIGSYAFMESYYLEKITIPDSVKSIGAIAFYCCYRLDNVAIPDSVINIGENAFYNCMAMEYIHIPSSVTTIGNNIIMPDDDKAELKTYFDSCTEDALVEFAHVGITKEHGSNWLPTTLICSDSENSAAKTFAEQNGNQFEVCNGHDSGETPDLITGECGDNLTWTFDESTGELVISGTGDMWDWGPDSAAPWYGGRSVIKAITISDGVTSIGNNAFVGCDVLTSVTIPDGVTSIGEYAFSQCTGLENITIGNNVTSIGDNAFTYCYALTSIIIPDSVTSIGDNAFAACTGLTSIEIPHSVTSLGDYVFAVCNGLTSITVDPANTAYSSDEYGVLFNKDKTELIRYPIGNTRTNYVIPDSVTSIVTAFQYCENLTSITIPDSVTSIGVQAFEGCVNLTSIEIPDSVTSIGDSAFYRCTGLTSVEISDSVTSIGDSAFYRCTSLTSIIIPDSVTSIGEYAFEGGTKITDVYYTGTEDEWNEITIGQNNNNLLNATIHYNYVAEETPTNGTCGDNLTWTLDTATGELVISGTGNMTNWSFDSAPWYNMRALIRSVKISDGVTSIGNNAFNDCDALTSVTIPDSVTSIGEKAFAYCDSLANVTIPDGVTSIGFNAFGWCESLISVTIGNSVTRIDDFAFISCNSLISITVDSSNTSYSSDEYGVLFNKNKTVLIQYPAGNTRTSYAIPDSVESIVDNAFYHCKNLTSVIIPYSVIDIGNDAFSNCESLTSVIIPDSVLSIGGYAFCNCSSLVSVKISGSVTSIGERAFGWCKSLESITVDSTNTSYSSDEYGVLFNKDKTVLIQYPTGNTRTSYTIPDSVTSIDDSAFEFSANLTSVTIGNSVKSIGNYAFVICPRLERIIIPDSVTTIGERVFLYCFRLEYIHISSSVTRIGDSIILSDSERADFIASFEDVWNNESEDAREIMESIGLTPEASATWPQTLICSDSENSAAKTYAEQNGNEFKVCGGDHREEFTVTLNIDGVQTVITLKEGDAISVEDPVKEGHTFIEWTPAIPDVMPAENLEFTAVFEVNSYTVIWNIDGMLITETHKFGELMDKSKSFEKKGYTFIGWTPEIPETMPACDLEFTALFEINICDAVFNANGGMFADGDLVKRIPTEMNAGILAPEDPERAGFRFAGWAYNGKNIGADVGVMDSTEGKIFDAVWIPNEKTAYKVETYTMNTYGEYEVSSMLVNAFVSEEVSVDITASEGFEINEEKSVLSGTVTSGEMLVLKVYIDRKQYKFTTVVLDTETTVLYYYGAAVPYPEWPSLDEYYVFEWWKPSPPAIMPANDVTITAQISEWNPRIVMSTPEKRTIYYGESITLRVQTYGLPSYAKIKWEVSGDGVSIKPSASGKTCKVTSTTNGNVVVKAYAVDSRGNTIEGYNLKPVCDSEYLYSKVSLWQVIVNFIRQLFNKNDNLSQFFKGIM